MAEVSYQTIEPDGSVGGGSVQVEEVRSLDHARQVAVEAAGEAEAVDVVTATDSRGTDLVAEWEDTWADVL